MKSNLKEDRGLLSNKQTETAHKKSKNRKKKMY